MPQVIVSIAASADDTNRFRGYNLAYPPPTPTGGNQNTNTLLAVSKLFEPPPPEYQTINIFMRFDTAPVIPDDAVITSALLRLNLGTVSNVDTRNINFEWYPWAPVLSDADYVDTVGTDANVTALSALTASDNNDLALTNPDANIVKTGTDFTGFRLGISGGVPTGLNRVYISAFDHATNPEPKLVVDYTEEPPVATVAWITA